MFNWVSPRLVTGRALTSRRWSINCALQILATLLVLKSAELLLIEGLLLTDFFEIGAMFMALLTSMNWMSGLTRGCLIVFSTSKAEMFTLDHGFMYNVNWLGDWCYTRVFTLGPLGSTIPLSGAALALLVRWIRSWRSRAWLIYKSVKRTAELGQGRGCVGKKNTKTNP